MSRKIKNTGKRSERTVTLVWVGGRVKAGRGGTRRGRISHLPPVSQRVTLEDEDDRYTAVLRWIQKE